MVKSKVRRKVLSSLLLSALTLCTYSVAWASHDPNFTGTELNIYSDPNRDITAGTPVPISGDMHFTKDNNIIFYDESQQKSVEHAALYYANTMPQGSSKATITSETGELFLKGREKNSPTGQWFAGYRQYANWDVDITMDTKLDIDMVVGPSKLNWYYGNAAMQINAHAHDTDPKKFVNKITFNKAVDAYVENAYDGELSTENAQGLYALWGQTSGVGSNEITFKDKSIFKVVNNLAVKREAGGIHIQDQAAFNDPSKYTFEDDVSVDVYTKKGKVQGLYAFGYNGAKAYYEFKKNFTAKLVTENSTGNGYGVIVYSWQTSDNTKPLADNEKHQERPGDVQVRFDGKVHVDLTTTEEKPTALFTYGYGGNAEATFNDTVTVKGRDDMYIAKAYTRKGDFETSSRIHLNGENEFSRMYLFYASGKNALIDVNKPGGKTQKLEGNVYSAYEGTIDINADTPESVLTININNYKKYDDQYNAVLNVNPKSGNEISGFTHISVSNKALWNVTTRKDNVLMIDTLTNSTDGIVDLTNVSYEDIYGQPSLIMKDLKGDDGIIRLKTDIINNKGQYIRILNSSAGNHKIDVRNAPGEAGPDPYKPVRVVDSAETPSDGGTFAATFSNLHDLEVGPYLYKIGNLAAVKGSEYIDNFPDFKDVDPNDWYLYAAMTKGQPTPTPSAEGGMVSLGTNYLGALAEMQTLRQRLGDIHHFDACEEDKSPWAKVFGGHFESNSNDYVPNMDYRYRGIQFGIDRRHDTVDGLSKIYRGLYGSFLKGTGEYDGGTVKGHQYTIGYYHSKQWDHRYSDFVLRFGHQKNDLDTVDTKKEAVFAKDISSNFFSISEEVGRRYEWVNKKLVDPSKTTVADKKSRWFIEPQAQVTYSHFGGTSFTTNKGLHGESSGFNSLLGRVGFLVENLCTYDNGNVGSYYGKVMYEREFLGKNSYLFNGKNTMTNDYRGGYFLLGLGANYSVKDKYEIYGEVDWSTHSKVFTKKYGFHVGAKFKF